MAKTTEELANERVVIFYRGEKTKIKRSFGKHIFSDGEIRALSQGETINFPTTDSKHPTAYRLSGKLGEKEYEGHKFVGFIPDFNFQREKAFGETITKQRFEIYKNTPYHCFTDDEITALSLYCHVIFDEYHMDGSIYRVNAFLEDESDYTATLTMKSTRIT